MTIMRTLSTTLALLFLGGALRAQQYTPSSGRELPHSRVTVTSVPFDSDEPDRPNRYMGRIDEWTQDDNRFTARFTVPFAWINRQVFLHVGHATADYEVRVNGRRIAYNNNGSSPAEYNLTKAVQEGANTLQIILSEPSATARMESWREEPAPSFGDVWLMSQPTMYIRDVLVKNWRPNAGDDFLMAEVGIVVKTASLNPRTTRVHYELLAPDGRSMLAGHDDMTLDMRREDTLRFIARIPDTLQWSAARPLRWTLRLKTQHEGRYDEYIELRPGFRTVDTADDRLLLNGKPVMLRGHEASPRISADEIAALRAQGYNMLLLLPGPVPGTFYEMCDSLGIYVIATAPIDTRSSGRSRRRGGNLSNDPSWQGAFFERAEDSYHTAKRHPSVIALSLARESENGINLYETYLRMKRLDESRPFIYPEAAGEWNTDRVLWR